MNDTDENRATVFVSNSQPSRRQWLRLRFSRRTLIIIAVVIVLITGGIVAFALTQKDTELPLSVATVEITDSGFNPVVIKVKKGERVQWVNKDSRMHQVAADPHPTSSSLPTLKSNDALLKDETYTAVLEKAGTFTYHDFLDPVNYQAAIIVE